MLTLNNICFQITPVQICFKPLYIGYTGKEKKKDNNSQQGGIAVRESKKNCGKLGENCGFW